MNKILDVYKCEKCGNIVEFLHGGAGPITCCGAPMVHQKENTNDASGEKHIPMITKLIEGYEVVVGNKLHPMEKDHYIEWIELIVEGSSHIVFLKPGDEPKAIFKGCSGKEVSARAYCNLHGHWKK